LATYPILGWCASGSRYHHWRASSRLSPDAYGENHLRLLGQIGNQLAVADNARLFETEQHQAADLEEKVSTRTRELENEHHRIETLLTIITELSSSLDLDVVLNRTLEVINAAVGADHCLVMLYNSESDALTMRASLGYRVPIPKDGQRSTLKPSQGLAGWVLTHRQSVLVPDLWQDERWMVRQGDTIVHRSALAVPLMMGDVILGVLLLYHREPNQFKADQLEMATATARQLAVAINNTQLYDLIRDQAERVGDLLRTQHIEASRSQSVLEAVADGVMVTDASRLITLFNPSAEHILGLNREQVLGKSLENFIGLFGKAGRAWAQTIRLWSETPSRFSPGETYAEQIDVDNHRVVSVHLSPVSLRGEFMGTVSVFRDITHLIEVDRLKSEFVATVSHELRTPMTSIKGYVDVLLMGAGGKLSDQQAHYLEIVKTNTERLAVLVNDLLDLSRIEAGKATLSFEPIELHRLAEDSAELITRRMQEEGRWMQLELDIPPDLPFAFGDLERVRQIFDNLLENAYQYTLPAGKIALRIRQLGPDIQVDVEDNGIGIHPNEQPRIFERFYRGEDPLVLENSGTGLGLSIVRHLVEMHHGRIWLESTGLRGEGSKFSFTIPAYSSTSQDATGFQAPQERQPVTSKSLKEG
jgi:PAS domain S-box-containing protein